MNKSTNYWEIMGYDKYPQWVVNRMTYNEDKSMLENLIKENQNWCKYYKNINQIRNSILHQEKVFYLQNILNNLEKGCEIND